MTARKSTIKRVVMGTSERPRASVYRSNNNVFVQIIDDTAGKTLAAASSIEIKDSMKPVEKAEKVGALVAKKALDKKISMIVFDRNGFKYHGQIKAVAEGMRSAGLTF